MHSDAITVVGCHNAIVVMYHVSVTTMVSWSTLVLMPIVVLDVMSHCAVYLSKSCLDVADQL